MWNDTILNILVKQVSLKEVWEWDLGECKSVNGAPVGLKVVRKKWPSDYGAVFKVINEMNVLTNYNAILCKDTISSKAVSEFSEINIRLLLWNCFIMFPHGSLQNQQMI